MYNLSILLALFLFSGSWAFAGDLPLEKIEWVDKSLSQINKKGIANIPKSKITGGKYKDTEGNWSHYIKSNGKITFKDGTWFVIVMHSMHTDAKLGDITIIQTSDGDFYYSLGHYCAELNLGSKHQKIDSLKKFLDTKGMVGDDVDPSWQVYKNRENKAQ